MRYRKNIGDIGEEFAARYLENREYRIVARNYATRQGEVDIIAVKDGIIHFIEVKTRSGNAYGYPSDSVTDIKQQRIRKAAQQYLGSRRLTWQNVSFDVFEIMTDHIENCM